MEATACQRCSQRCGDTRLAPHCSRRAAVNGNILGRQRPATGCSRFGPCLPAPTYRRGAGRNRFVSCATCMRSFVTEGVLEKRFLAICAVLTIFWTRLHAGPMFFQRELMTQSECKGIVGHETRLVDRDRGDRVGRPVGLLQESRVLLEPMVDAAGR